MLTCPATVTLTPEQRSSSASALACSSTRQVRTAPRIAYARLGACAQRRALQSARVLVNVRIAKHIAQQACLEVSGAAVKFLLQRRDLGPRHAGHYRTSHTADIAR